MKQLILIGALAISAGSMAVAQQPAPAQVPPAQTPTRLPASPPGNAQTQVGGSYVKDDRGRERYQGGKWIEITYSRPIKRGRDVFGTGADYGKALLVGGATVWRAGANVSTRLRTEAPLIIGGKTVPAGEYSLFIDLKSPSEWTLIVSSYGAKTSGNDQTPDTLWGSFKYTPDKDVARAPMTVNKSQASVDQLTWGFCDVTETGGKLFLAWDTTNATLPFTLGK
jgi:hypothetical protein